jgi:hypothetical protein
MEDGVQDPEPEDPEVEELRVLAGLVEARVIGPAVGRAVLESML